MRSLSLLIILPLAFSMNACAPAPPESTSFDIGATALPITGGRPTLDAEWPAVVSLGGCTGTLVQERLVVFAAHCGTAISSVRFGSNAEAPERVVATSRCDLFPNTRLGDGTDLAYCVLAEPVLDVEPERILAGCEAEAELTGEPAWVVGYGLDKKNGKYGQKRVGASRIQSVGDELFLEPSEVDTCKGDSGGPLFVEREEPDGTRQRRLLGVTSAGSESECGTGVGHYVNISRKVDWLEQASQLDVTPCFAGADWLPQARCRATAASTLTTEVGEAAPTAKERPALATCGAAFSASADETQPLLEWTSPQAPDTWFDLRPGTKYVETELAVAADDTGWGVEQVTFSLRGANHELLLERVDQVPPFGLTTLRLPPGRFFLAAEARDYAGNTKESALELTVATKLEPAGGCSLSPGPTPGSGPGALAFLLALTARLARSYAKRVRVRAPP